MACIWPCIIWLHIHLSEVSFVAGYYSNQFLSKFSIVSLSQLYPGQTVGSGKSQAYVNWLALGWSKWNITWVVLKLVLVVDGWAIACKLPSDECHWTILMTVLVLVMTWCYQATSICLNQCWPISVLPYGMSSPLWFQWSVLGSCISTWKVIDSTGCLAINSSVSGDRDCTRLAATIPGLIRID